MLYQGHTLCVGSPCCGSVREPPCSEETCNEVSRSKEACCLEPTPKWCRKGVGKLTQLKSPVVRVLGSAGAWSLSGVLCSRRSTEAAGSMQMSGRGCASVNLTDAEIAISCTFTCREILLIFFQPRKTHF